MEWYDVVCAFTALLGWKLGGVRVKDKKISIIERMVIELQEDDIARHPARMQGWKPKKRKCRGYKTWANMHNIDVYGTRDHWLFPSAWVGDFELAA